MKNYRLNMTGCESAVSYLTSALSGGYLSHAYIIEGAEGSGRHTLIKQLLMAMACDNDDAPCGRCDNCVRIGSGYCVDIYNIRTEEGKSVLTVDQIRSIYDTVGLMPNDLPFKAYIIEDGENMNANAQNAFLKLFEEPPENVYFFILTTDVSKLLPTVRSRALVLRTSRLDHDGMCAVLDKNGIPDGKKREGAISLANGSAGEAMRIYAEDSDSMKLRDTASAVIDALFLPGSDKLSFMILHHKNIKKTEDLCRVYSLVHGAVRDVMLNRLSARFTPVWFLSADDLADHSLHVSDRAVIKTDAVINELLSVSDIPLNPGLAVTEFASRIWDAHLI